MRNRIVQYKQLPSGVHVTINSKGKIKAYTPSEWLYKQQTVWWNKIVDKYFS